MKRIIFFIGGFLTVYLVSVVVLNMLPAQSPEPQSTQTPQIQIQQPQEEATPSAQEEIIQPDL